MTADEVCEWFLLCMNGAAGVVEHPVLGDVPTCTSCAEKLGLTLMTPPNEGNER